MPRFAFALCTICFSVFLASGCGSDGGDEGAVIPEEEQPTEEELNAEPEIPGDNI